MMDSLSKEEFTDQVCKKFGLTKLPSLAALELLREHTDSKLTRCAEFNLVSYSVGEDTTNWAAICASPNPAAMELLQAHPEKLNLAALCRSTNPEAIAQVELRLTEMDDTCWSNLSANSSGAAIQLMMLNPTKMVWSSLAKNQSPDVEELLMCNLDKLAPWYRECTNPVVFNRLLAVRLKDLKQSEVAELSRNPAATWWLKANPDKISDRYLERNTNPAAVELGLKRGLKIEGRVDEYIFNNQDEFPLSIAFGVAAEAAANAKAAAKCHQSVEAISECSDPDVQCFSQAVKLLENELANVTFARIFLTAYGAREFLDYCPDSLRHELNVKANLVDFTPAELCAVPTQAAVELLLAGADTTSEEWDWWALCRNPACSEILKQFPWKWNWAALSNNPNAGRFLRAHPDMIDWLELSDNPSPEALELLKNNPWRIDWSQLCFNPNPEVAGLIIASGMTSIDSDDWDAIIMENPALFERLYHVLVDNVPVSPVKFPTTSKDATKSSDEEEKVLYAVAAGPGNLSEDATKNMDEVENVPRVVPVVGKLSERRRALEESKARLESQLRQITADLEQVKAAEEAEIEDERQLRALQEQIAQRRADHHRAIEIPVARAVATDFVDGRMFIPIVKCIDD